MKFIALLVALLLPSAAFAQSSATETTPGLLTNSGCTGTNSVCWKPFSATNPLPIAVYDSGNHAGYCYTSNGSASPATFQVCGGGGGTGTVTSVSVATANGFSGTVANPTTTPAITIIAGAITPTSVNGLTISNTTGTLTMTNAKTLSVSNTLTFTGTDGSTVNFGTGGTVLYGNQTITLSGDTTGSGTTAITTTTSKVNGVSYGTSPSTNTVPVVTGANTVTYQAVPNAALANASTTVSGQTCTLGSSCTVAVTGLASIAANTIVGNNTGSSAAPAAQTSFVISGSGTASNFNATTTSTGYQMNGATGFYYNSADSGTAGSSIGIGISTLVGQTSSAAYRNIAIGYQSMAGTMTTAAIQNVAIGYQAGTAITQGNGNVYVGYQAGNNTTTGTHNICIGDRACQSLGAAANQNINIGDQSKSGSGQDIVFIGRSSGGSSMTGNGNVSVGNSNLTSLGTGASNNLALGNNTGTSITTGSNNLAIGPAVGNSTLTTGSRNIMIGVDSSTTAPAAGTVNWLNIGNAIYGQDLKNNTNTGGVPLLAIGTGITSVTAGAVLDLSNNTTTANSSLLLPVGTSAARPGTGVNGMLRYNSTLAKIEGYMNGMWQSLAANSNGAPTCGTGCTSIGSGATDLRGTFTTDVTVTAATLNFSATLPAAPICIFNDDSTASLLGHGACSTSACTVNFATAVTSSVVSYICIQ